MADGGAYVAREGLVEHQALAIHIGLAQGKAIDPQASHPPHSRHCGQAQGHGSGPRTLPQVGYVRGHQRDAQGLHRQQPPGKLYIGQERYMRPYPAR